MPLSWLANVTSCVAVLANAATFANADSHGIYTSDNLNGSITGNRVRGLVKNGTGGIYAIFNRLSDRITLRNNDVVGDGSTKSTGLRCNNTSTGRALNNLVSGFAIAIENCTGGGNEIVP